MKIKVARDIIIPNIYVKVILNPLINAGPRAMTKFI